MKKIIIVFKDMSIENPVSLYIIVTHIHLAMLNHLF